MEEHIKINLKEIEFEDVDWIQITKEFGEY
jgi:hypothetical protein